MKCDYCNFINIDEEHRCRRCGRRLQGTAQAAPAHRAEEHMRIAVRALGANALAAQPVARAAPEKRPVPQASVSRASIPPASIPPASIPSVSSAAVSLDTVRALNELPKRASQPSLFGAELQPKIIPFDARPRTPGTTGIPVGGGAAAAPAIEMPRPIESEEKTEKTRSPKPAVKTAVKKHEAEEAQSTLDFRPPAKPASRILKTNAEAVIYCDAAVAAPVHRVTAAALDGSMVLLAFGGMLGIFVAMARPGGLSRTGLLLTGGLLFLTALLYGLLFAIAGTTTPGLRWTNLRLINFDGFRPDWRSRALRLGGCWISALSGGLGLLWALVDEENLTWHDHISKSFPTLRESESVVVRHKG